MRLRVSVSVSNYGVRVQRYLDHIQKYADGSARSKVGNAVRRGVCACACVCVRAFVSLFCSHPLSSSWPTGVAAHEFDDIIDDHGSEKRPKPA